ncbi:hypothetical protein JGH11_14540 [Dysgonomonas sp. Marseille-P4677]|uniref:hypothetical protein n=1 Tax=Dysgonomonas sp. Marseille-P4677 TaxID=2364790 RepID=UPI00191494FD|nr:hypothetical protein [Dysgonomonas sp. Marseille-P4677]MBK5722093.1 hypothetical protein [Dysgonomonas sp. Marseille-P4677]
MTTKSANPNIKKGYAILNIVIGVILLISGIMLIINEPDIILAGFGTFSVGLIIFIIGSYSLNISSKAKNNENIVISPGLKLANIICFIISCLILLFVLTLAVILSL